MVEVICQTPEDCIAAEQGGAGRIELVSAIELGGLTPSIGAFSAARSSCALPLVGMLRPRTGGFCYTDGEFDVMREDVRRLSEAGAGAFVFGILTSTSEIDTSRCRALISTNPSAEWIFHRAFDIVPEPFAALGTLIELGFRRILTSGQKPTALEGADLIRKLIQAAKGRIEVLPGGGIKPGNVKEVLAGTGATQVHASAWVEASDPSTRNAVISFNGRPGLESGCRATSAELVRELRSVFPKPPSP